MRLILAAAFFAFAASSALGQSASDIEAKYGKPTNVYAVSQNIWMTPEYTADGQVCEMLLYPRRIAPDAINLSNKLPFDELQIVLNKLVPVNTRGVQRGNQDCFRPEPGRVRFQLVQVRHWRPCTASTRGQCNLRVVRPERASPGRQGQ